MAYTTIPASGAGGTISTSSPVSGDGSGGSPVTIATNVDMTVGEITVSASGDQNNPQVKVGDANNGLFTGGGIALGAVIPAGGGSGTRVWLVPSDGVGTQLLATGGGEAHIGNGSLATTATGGDCAISTSAGAPTGVPAALFAGWSAIRIDTTNGLFYAYYGGAWHFVALT